MAEISTQRRTDRIETVSALLRRDAFWITLATVVGSVALLAYLTTHSHPAYEGGLYLQIVEQIRAGGYALPTHIPYYTPGGVLFAYPPLMFYVVAALVDLTGVDPVTLMLVLPGIVTVVALVPTYLVARELLDSVPQAGIATVLFAGTPAVLRWHISAGGIVRAPAFLFSMVGVYAGIRLFRDEKREYVVLAAVLFGLTVLTHPHYVVFFGLSYLLLFAAFDRTPTGLVTGAVVAVGGLLLAAPWWLQVAATHGPDVFFAAAGSQHGLGGGLARLQSSFLFPLETMDARTPFYLLAFLGTGYLLVTRRYVLPAWLLALAYVLGKARFMFVPGAMAGAVVLVEGASSLRERAAIPQPYLPALRSVLVLLVVVSAATAGGLYAGSALQVAHQDSHSQPQTVDQADKRAMEWVARETDPDASFVVLGDTAEWFPYMTERTSVVSPWGMEWTTPTQYYTEVRQFRRLSTCDTGDCLSRRLADENRRPDYVYIPRGEYTVRGKEQEMAPAMRRSLVDNPRFEPVYQNAGVTIVAVRLPPTALRDHKTERDGSIYNGTAVKRRVDFRAR